MERGDTGAGRDAYGQAMRRETPRVRPGTREYGQDSGGSRAYPGHGGQPGDGGYRDGAPGRDDEDGDYGQLLRRPGEMPPRPPRFRPGRGRLRPQAVRQPNRYPPGNGAPGNGAPGNPGFPGAFSDDRYGNAGPMTGGPRPGYDAGPGGRRAAGGPWPRRAPDDGPWPRQMPDGAPLNGQRPDGRPAGYSRPAGYGAGRVPPSPGRQYLAGNGRRVPPRADRLFRSPVPPNAYQAPGTRPAGPGPAAPGPGVAGPGVPGYPGGAQGGGPDGYRGRGPAPQRPRFRPPGQAEVPPAQLSGQVIRQRDTAVPESPEASASQPVAAIAPDGLESFARDLRALRAKAELDYPEMAERSHYTMKTLASAAGGLRLPTLPVAVAYVRACGGDVAEWEDRWHKLAEKITAEAAKKQQGEDLPEPAEASQVQGTQTPGAQQSQQPGPGNSDVYVITSAKPRQPGW